MKLLHAMAGAPTGGAEGFFGRLAAGLAEAGVEQSCIIRADAAREDLLRGLGIAVKTASFGGLLDFSTRACIRNEITGFDPDVVLSWMNRATRHMPRRSTSARYVHIGTPRGYYDPKYYPRCDHLIVTTEDLKDFYVKAGWSPEKVSTIPNFVADRQAEPLPRATFDTPDGVPLLLALGRLHENKGFDVLIRAMAELPEYYLWIGGDGPLEQPLKALAAETGTSDRIRFLGWQDDSGPLYEAADIFVCSSRHEPFGNIVIESWMHRTPVVAAASEGPGALIRNGETGLLCEIEDASALAAAIADITDTDRLARAGRAEYEARYAPEAVIPVYLSLFERLTE